MNIINIENIHKLFGDTEILDGVSLGIQDTDKIGIVGVNGCGKSTLLKILSGEEEADSGQVIMQNGLRVSYLPQMPEFPENMTILEYVAGGDLEYEWTGDSQAATILNKLGIADHDRKLGILSGGQKKAAALARLLVNPSDVLILDEPTNHLDSDMIAWIEEYLARYKGAIIVVTHDRYFLDKVTNKIAEISHGSIYTYEGNYSTFLNLKAEREEMELASDRKRRSLLRMELEWAKRGCRARSTKQRARLERLEALKAGKTPVADANVEIGSRSSRMGRKTVLLHHISKSYAEKPIIRDFDYVFLKNQNIGIIGANGCGKSTLLQIINGETAPDSGEVELGETIRMSYFAQNVPDMDTSEKVIDYIRDVAEYIDTKDGKVSASKMLEQFLFDAEAQYTPISKLSGGEKRRLYLLKVLMEAPNVLLLDEPSNDLDIPTLTILEDYLQSFGGIVIAVSHDRYFLDNFADRIFAFEDARLVQYEGGYTDYAESVNRKGTVSQASDSPNREAKKKSAEKTWKQNQPTKLKFSFKEQREYDTIDEEIEKLETKIAGLEEDMMKFATNSFKLQEIAKEKEEAETLLEEKMDRWVYLNDKAEQIASQK